MAQTKAITLIVLITILLQGCFVTAHLDEMRTVPRPPVAQTPDVNEKTKATKRFLRGGDVDEGVKNEGRGFLRDKFVSIPSVKWGLRISLKQYDGPAKILKEFQQFGIPLNVDYLLLWMNYVLKYKAKMGTIWATDAYVVQTLKDFVPASQLPYLFNAMKKNSKLRDFAIDL
ncbi:RxLR effector protein, partial [Phytophthora megakarya]